MMRVFYNDGLSVPAMVVADDEGNIAVVLNVHIVESLSHLEQASLFNDLFASVSEPVTVASVPLRAVS